jgi:hypothetical protein
MTVQITINWDRADTPTPTLTAGDTFTLEQRTYQIVRVEPGFQVVALECESRPLPLRRCFSDIARLEARLGCQIVALEKPEEPAC